MIIWYHGSNVEIKEIDLPADKLVEELKYHADRAGQYFFGTPRAIKLLKHIEL